MPEKYPEKDDFVVVKVSKVLAYGAFAGLEEYPALGGFVHISQVASSWVKNIRNHVKENQIRVAQVISVDEGKKQVELSFTKVSSNQQKLKLEEWKQNKRAKKLLQFLSKQNKSTEEIVAKEVATPLIENYGTVMDGFKAYLLEGDKVFESIPVKWRKSLATLVTENLKIQAKIVRGEIKISSKKDNGVQVIKDVLKNSIKLGGKSTSIWYEGGGKYTIESQAQDYKSAEKNMMKSVSSMEKEFKKEKTDFTFTKQGK